MKAKRLKPLPRIIYLIVGLLLLVPMYAWAGSMTWWTDLLLGMTGISFASTGALGFCPAAPIYYWAFSR